MNNLGNLNSELQRYDEALNYYKEAFELSQKTGNVFADPLNNIGNLYFKQGDYASAAGFYEQSLKLARKENNLLLKLNVLTSLGEVYAHGSQFKMAQMYLDSALTLSNTLEAYIYEPTILKSLCIHLFQAGKNERSL